MNNHKSPFVLLLFVWTLVSGGILSGQQIDEDAFHELLVSQKNLIVWMQQVDGSLLAYNSEEDTLIPVVEFYLHPTVVAELKFTEDVESQIKQQYDRCLAGLKDQLTELFAKVESGEKDRSLSEDVRNQILDARREFFSGADSLLSEKQKLRLRQVQLQLLFHRNGFINLIGNPVAKRILQVEGTVKPVLKNRIKAIRADLERKEREILSDAIGTLLSGFDDSQRELFDREWKHVHSRPGALGQLSWQLNFEAVAPFDAKPNDDLFERGMNRTVLSHGVDGNTAATGVKETKFLVGGAPFYSIDGCFRSKFFQELIQLADFQYDESREIFRRFDQKKEMLVAETAVKFDVPIRTVMQIQPDESYKELLLYDWPKDNPTIFKAMDDRLYPVAISARDEMLEILLPMQQKLLQNALRQLEIRSRGPVCDVKYGELGTILGLSDEDKQMFVERAENVRQTVYERTRKARDEAMGDLIGILEEQDRSRLQQLLGAPIENGYCDLYLFGYALLFDSNE